MDAFLQEVAQQLLDKHGRDMRDVTVVFNNHRSGIFLQKHLSKMTQGSLFIPTILGIDDLVMTLGHTKIVPNEFLLFELYRIHEELEGRDRKYQTFDAFISFGEMMLSDFSEIDLYMADAKDLFSNIYDHKKLGEWDLEAKPLTEMQKSYLRFYERLYEYYQNLHERLSSKGEAYSGMAYRQVAENIDTLIENYLPKDIYFVGWNALSECEVKIIQAYTRRGNGHMVTDGDKYYYSIEESHEAGRFLKKHKPQFDEIGDYPEHFALNNKKIKIVSCAENVLQTKYAGHLLREGQGVAAEDTAIVLADESLLMPMLNSLPSNIKGANVTMGFPFTASEAHSLIMKLFALYARARKRSFYHQDILDVVSDHFVSKLLYANNIRAKFTAKMKQANIIRADLHIIQEVTGELSLDISPIAYLFENGDITPDTFLERAHRLVVQLYESGVTESRQEGDTITEKNQKESEALACLLQIIDHFVRLQKEYHFVDEMSTLQKIYSRMAKRRSIAFYGEPLSGLQILGVLETRNLDFKRVIMLSTNEGLLPSGRSSNTLIPMFLKSHFGIPTFREKDAVYAYHFYRFLQRAEEVYLVYSSESDGMGKGEASRFILQVKEELQRQYPDNIEVESLTVTAESQQSDAAPIASGKKTASVMKRLHEMATGKGFSPSALNNYRSCPLMFYYCNVLYANENETITDELDQSELGSCIHKVLEEIYQIDPNGQVKAATLKEQRAKLKETISNKFDEMFLNGMPHEGRNLLMQSIAETQIGRFLDKEIKLLESGSSIKIISPEKEMKHALEIEIDGKKEQVKIHGFADRIDQVNGQTRVIDYKSGGVEERELKVAPKTNEIPDKLFQLMTYSWLWQHEKDAIIPVEVGIVPLRKLNVDFMPAQWNGDSKLDQDRIKDFENDLKDVVAEIMNPQIDFEARTTSKSCKYCPMNCVCK